MIQKNNIKENKLINNLIEELLTKKELSDGRYIENKETATLKENKKTIMEVSNDLVLSNKGVKSWLVKPRKLPIMPQDKLIINLFNHSDENKTVSLKGFYSVPKVINVEIRDEENNLVDS